MKQWYLLFIAYGNLWENATVLHNCISLKQQDSYMCSFHTWFYFKAKS